MLRNTRHRKEYFKPPLPIYAVGLESPDELVARSEQDASQREGPRTLTAKIAITKEPRYGEPGRRSESRRVIVRMNRQALSLSPIQLGSIFDRNSESTPVLTAKAGNLVSSYCATDLVVGSPCPVANPLTDSVTASLHALPERCVTKLNS